jgi:hypothetical protein
MFCWREQSAPERRPSRHLNGRFAKTSDNAVKPQILGVRKYQTAFRVGPHRKAMQRHAGDATTKQIFLSRRISAKRMRCMAHGE